ncbi:MAG: radical SAM protein, partial [Ruminococcus sp.]|nr:radical SAM protein [Ruminococcus sp.]
IFSAKYVKALQPKIKLRLNTNGLSDLINGRKTAAEICSVFDSVSISLNAPSSEEYDKITRNIFPGKAFDAMISFTSDCVKCGTKTRMSVVDVIGSEKVQQAKKIAESLGADFICRKFDE